MKKQKVRLTRIDPDAARAQTVHEIRAFLRDAACRLLTPAILLRSGLRTRLRDDRHVPRLPGAVKSVDDRPVCGHAPAEPHARDGEHFRVGAEQDETGKCFEQSGEVIPDYIRPRNLVSTLGFPMRDATDRIRTIFALDRLSDAPYTDWEIETVRSIRELLKLFHRLLFTCADDEAAQLTSRTELQTLTPREMEIVNLLEQGITPANIAHILHITVPTTNRHIYNIYKKVNVNSRAELMAKIK